MDAEQTYEVVVVGATPGGIMAAIAAARRRRSVVLLSRTRHPGGLPANGLGATDIATRGATGGLFSEFVKRVKAHYVATYGPGSAQVTDCSDGFHFEPHVAAQVFAQMLAEQGRITVKCLRQFDADPANVVLEHGTVRAITVTDRETGQREVYRGQVFIDGTYEGDLAAAAGCDFTTRREGRDEYDELGAGRIYKPWGGEIGEGSTGEGDDTIQAYNYRLCLTNDPTNRRPIPKPETYHREEYVSMVDDVLESRTTGRTVPEGIARLTNMVALPNHKTDSNNQHLAFISTDLPEENYPWPTAGWAWRDQFAQRLRDYTLGLLWFAQHDEALPAEFREACLEWGFAADEYLDNDHFPRQVYVREGRRITGEHFFTAHDARPTKPGGRPPLYADSITASHYALDSHAHHKREPGRCHLDGFLSFPSKPYTVPYGVMLPKGVDGLLTPVPVSGSHIGFSTLRMEPCWMALGQAAGTAAALAIESRTSPRKVDRTRLQYLLLRQRAVLLYYQDLPLDHPAAPAAQWLGLRGLLPGWKVELSQPVTADEAKAWCLAVGCDPPPCFRPGGTTREVFLSVLSGRLRG